MRGGPRLFSTAGPLERSASWSLREPSVFDVGAGPTVATALEVSKRPEDLRLVTAAWRNELEKVEEVLGEADLEAHVRLPGFLRATTALHAASSAGAVAVVQRLIEARATVSGGHGQLRQLTPLHDAATLEVALQLMAARANPWANDPREPDPAWYHEQRHRHDIAHLIRQRRNEMVNGGYGGYESAAMQLAQLPVLPLSSQELQSVKSSFSAKGAAVLHLCEGDPESAECSICMVEMLAEDDILCLPCGASPDRKSSCRPHAFHLKCLEKWLLTKAGACPICRHSLRGKRKTRSAPARHREILQPLALQPLAQPLQPQAPRVSAERVAVAKPRTRSARHRSGLPLPEIETRALLR